MSEIYLTQAAPIGQTGPHTEEDLRWRVKGGQISGKTLAWKEGISEWIPVEDMLGLTPKQVPSAIAAGITALAQRSTRSLQNISPSRQADASVNEVVITGINIPFGQMVRLLLNIMVASIPAMILFSVIVIGIFFVLSLLGLALVAHH